MNELRGLASGLLLLAACGCGASADVPDLARVTGTVTLDDQPLPNATVIFTPTGEGRPSTGTTNDSGKYELLYTANHSGAIIGPHIVTIQLISEDDEESYEGGDDEGPGNLPRSAVDGSIKKEVTSGSNTIDIKLSTRG